MEPKLPERIPYGGIEDDFSIHLNLDDNYRIIFSGRFGSGKTEFLKQFFKENIDENKPDFNYEVFRLYPVNYQVAANSDIFELIKYDILFRLYDKAWFDSPEHISHLMAVQSFFLQEGPGHLLKVLKNIKFHGLDQLAGAASDLLNVFDEYGKYYKKLNRSSSNLFKDFRFELKETRGSIYEFDSISKLIAETIENKKGEKKTVLIIDDLDRIDPEHIFRLLNVFSAHFDSTETRTNKFGFDKIIFVCDIENIRKIFYHKYGADVDFNGYINKFYSKEVFEFDLSKEILKKLDNILNPLIYQIRTYFHGEVKELLYTDYFRNDVRFLINCFVKVGMLSIRNIENFNKSTNYISKYFPKENAELPSEIEVIYFFLVEMLEPEIIQKGIEKCIENKNDILFYPESVTKLTDEIVKFLIQKNKNDTIERTFNLGDIEILYNGEKASSIRYRNQEISSKTSELAFLLLQKAFAEIEKSRSLA
jgi:hypothetical protein